MDSRASEPAVLCNRSIVDNSEGNKLLDNLAIVCQGGTRLWVAAAFFSLDALNELGPLIQDFGEVRILFGDEASKTTRAALLHLLRQRSDEALRDRRAEIPLLNGLEHVRALIAEGKLQARVYKAEKFHAKAYIVHKTGAPPQEAFVGSSNFTRLGLTQNVELNVHLSPEQRQHLVEWYEDMWARAEEDDVTQDFRKEIERQVRLYEPHAIYLKALLAWGDFVQGRDSIPDSRLQPILDPHQEDAFRQALKIVDREGGAMICDGVGLGKSFVALALMEHFLRQGNRVMLVAPKAILEASWEGYIRDYLQRYKVAYSSLVALPMTWFGFEPEPSQGELAKLAAEGVQFKEIPNSLQELYDSLDMWTEQAEVVVIDESHNFRKTNSQRYINLLRMLQTRQLGKKKVILLTATPLNTEYTDVTAQFRLVTLEGGVLGGYPIEQLQREAVRLDLEARQDPDRQRSLFSEEAEALKLREALSSLAIQRSRATCRKLAEARGKRLRFPERDDPSHIDYNLSEPYAQVVQKAENDFTELAKFISVYRRAVKKAADDKKTQIEKRNVPLPKKGLRLSAYLPDRYRRSETDSLRDAQTESFLVMLVFANVMKQLESSPEAFLGILRSLGAGLCARLHYVFGEEVEPVLAKHITWIRDRIKHLDADEEAFEHDVTILGDDDQSFLDHAIKSRNIRKGLVGFTAETHDLKNWRSHIESDLDKLSEIYEYAAAARAQGEDLKLIEVAEVVHGQIDQGRKVLIFTQSVRTAEYLYKELPGILGVRVERVDANVQGERRRRLLHEFSPKYNPIENPSIDFQPLQVLVCTDVLSEGVNLQEAGCILNYDLHWNPVRLIQRIGRVDRRLRDDDPGHRFSIYNVIPPPEIERLIALVDTVEGRTRKISRLLGLDQAFFSADDDAGTLREFNAVLEGSVSRRDEALSHYTEAIHLTPDQVLQAESVPAGGLGVWKWVGKDPGLFALFRVAALPTASDEELERLKPVLGRPILIMRSGEVVTTEATDILSVLSHTVPGEPSAMPSDPEVLKVTLKDLRSKAFSTLREVPEKHRLTLHLECWLEIRKKETNNA